MEERFRKKFSEIITLDYFRNLHISNSQGIQQRSNTDAGAVKTDQGAQPPMPGVPDKTGETQPSAGQGHNHNVY